MSVFYFAWVDAAETTFGAEHHVIDEEVFSVDIGQEEGEATSLALEISNPRIGLLNPGRKVWAWLSYDNGVTVTPMFFGRLIGTPDNLFAEIITLNFLARPADYVARKQIVAAALKVAPAYDPVFLTPLKRDDPDAILEGYSRAWDINRVTGVVSTTDVLEGEDGTEVFESDEVPYDSVSMTLGEPPLSTVAVMGAVTWKQEATGYLDFGRYTFESYSGDGILADWPKPLTQLGDGWSVAFSTAVDVYGVTSAQTVNFSYSWRNEAKKHIDGDTMSVRVSDSKPILPGEFLSAELTAYVQNGLLDPNALDGDGDPAPINIPEQVQITSTYVPLWTVNTSLVLRYDASREREERVHFLLQADVQPILTDATVEQVSETLEIQGADVSEPILNVLNWTSVAGQAVSLGQIVFPDVRTIPGQQTVQIATTAGTAGTTVPTFSHIAGATTADGSVVWTSLGTSTPSGSAQDWSPDTEVPLGQMILPRRPIDIAWRTLALAGLLQRPRVGVAVSVGQIISTSGGNYQICSQSGETGLVEPSFSSTWGATTVDGTAEWTSLGTALPLGSVFFICTDAGTTGSILPPFDNTTLATTTDGTAVWTSIGVADLPIGGSPGNTPRDNYFPTDRGLRSLEYLLCVARAHLRRRARPVQLSFDVPFERALTLSCRKSATLNDDRLPGGTATGKVVSYTISVDGDSGALRGSVTIACAVGTGIALSAVAGTPVYAAPGYAQAGWQYMEGATVLVDETIGYTPPARGLYDDGLVFPLSREAVVQEESTHGNLDDQAEGIELAFESARAAAIEEIEGPATTSSNWWEVFHQQEAIEESQNSVAFQLKQNPIWYELQLAPLTNGPFVGEYFVTTEPIVVPKLIDLEAASI